MREKLATAKKTYQGRPCKLGHTERYACNGGCVTCIQVRSAAWKQANPEKRRARAAAWYEAHHEELLARSAAWRQANPEKHRAHVAAWQQANPEKARAHKAAWRKANPEKVRDCRHRRRARKSNAPTVTFTQAELDAHLDRLGRKCVYCDGPYEHWDHVRPLALGGEHSLANLVPACLKCNLSKGSKSLGAWFFGTDMCKPVGNPRPLGQGRFKSYE